MDVLCMKLDINYSIKKILTGSVMVTLFLSGCAMGFYGVSHEKGEGTIRLDCTNGTCTLPDQSDKQRQQSAN
jgi:hypothetical protein